MTDRCHRESCANNCQQITNDYTGSILPQPLHTGTNHFANFIKDKLSKLIQTAEGHYFWNGREYWADVYTVKPG